MLREGSLGRQEWKSWQMRVLGETQEKMGISERGGRGMALCINLWGNKRWSWECPMGLWVADVGNASDGIMAMGGKVVLETMEWNDGIPMAMGG